MNRPDMKELKIHSESCGFQDLYAWTVHLEKALNKISKGNPGKQPGMSPATPTPYTRSYLKVIATEALVGIDRGETHED